MDRVQALEQFTTTPFGEADVQRPPSRTTWSPLHGNARARAARADGEEIGWHGDPDVDRMLRVRDGDSQAFQELFVKYSHPLFSFAFRFLGNRARAEEIVQDAFLQIYRARSRYKAQARFFTYACRVVANLCVNEKRRFENRCRVESLDAGANGTDGSADELADTRCFTGEQHAACAELATRLHDVLAKLPERRRAALLLSRIDGVSQREVAWILSTSESAVKSLVFRAMATLRGELQDFIA